MKRSILIATAIGLAFVGVAAALGYGDDDAPDQQAVARALPAAKVALEKGVAAAGSAHGTPISAKYEVEDGKLQLSVYTRKGDGFFEVIVDHQTGQVAKAEAITSGEDLDAAKAQQQAMARASRTLGAAIEDAMRQSPGFRAVSAMPRLTGGHPVAVVTLLKGGEWKTVETRLDG